MSYVQIQTTHDDREALQMLIHELLAERLIACGKVLGPITSVYWWKGSVETAEEWIALLNTSERAADAAIEAIRTKHSYDVPEILVFEVGKGLSDYLAWIDESTTG